MLSSKSTGELRFHVKATVSATVDAQTQAEAMQALCDMLGQPPEGFEVNTVSAVHAPSVDVEAIVCQACGSTDTYGYPGNAGCNGCGRHDQDGG